MKFQRADNETWFHHKMREWGSGQYPGPLWYRALLGGVYAIRRMQSHAAERRYKKHVKGRPQYDPRLTDDMLTYASHARCDCGAGLAYPNGIGIRGCWSCSDLLTGRKTRDWTLNEKHVPELPFMFYEIKSENQPSANGATTRPGVKRVILGELWNRYERAA